MYGVGVHNKRRRGRDGAPKTDAFRNHLPPEILDYIADLLHDKSETLRGCCLVSKSWIPRTRKHVFADISFHSPADLELWKKTPPDHSSSPAHRTQTLLVGCPEVATVVDVGEGGWIQTFFTRCIVGGAGQPSERQQPGGLSPHSTDSRPSSNPSVFFSKPSQSRRFPT